MGMKCRCGGEIDFTTGRCKKCKKQNINMSGNASIKITDANGDTTELISRHKKKENIKFNIE